MSFSGNVGASLVRLNSSGLRAVVEAGNLAQHAFGAVAVDDVAAGEEGERAEAGGAAQEAAPRRIGHQLGRVLDQQLGIDAGDDFAVRAWCSYFPTIMARRLFGTSSASGTCTQRKPTIALMAKKCT